MANAQDKDIIGNDPQPAYVGHHPDSLPYDEGRVDGQGDLR